MHVTQYSGSRQTLSITLVILLDFRKVHLLGWVVSWGHGWMGRVCWLVYRDGSAE